MSGTCRLRAGHRTDRRRERFRCRGHQTRDAIETEFGSGSHAAHGAYSPSRPEFGTALSPASQRKSRKTKRVYGGERGIRTLEGLLTLTPLAGVRLRPLG